MPKISKKNVVWLLTGLQSMLCLWFVPAWIAVCFLSAVAISKPGMYDEEAATFMVVVFSSLNVLGPMWIHKWNRKTTAILWTLVMMGPGALSFADLKSAPEPEEVKEMFGVSTFMDLPKWCFWVFFVLFLASFILYEPLMWIAVNVFLCVQIVFVLMFAVLVLVSHARTFCSVG